MTFPSAPATDFVLPELMRLLPTAQTEIDEQCNDHGRCATCRVGFRCDRAVLADLALSVL